MKGKKIIIPIAVAVVALVGVIIAVVLLVSNKKEEYRIVKVYQTQGDVIVSREKTGAINAYDNMVLETGDYVKVGKGLLTLKLDDDKYVYADENTEFELLVSGSAANSKTTINLVEGTLTNDIQNKLNDESYYEINTPNSTMSVRGTVPRIIVYKKDGVYYTEYQVFEGNVVITLKTLDGKIIEKSVELSSGQAVTVYADDNVTDFLGEVREISIDEIPDELKEHFEKIIEIAHNADLNSRDGLSKWLVKDEPEEEVEGEVEVLFMYKGQVFATQTVMTGDKVKAPILQPADSGSWDYDFSKSVDGETEINWK